MSCLLNHYKDFSLCPRHIDAKVIEVEDMTQTAQLRKKLQVRALALLLAHHGQWHGLKPRGHMKVSLRTDLELRHERSKLVCSGYLCAHQVSLILRLIMCAQGMHLAAGHWPQSHMTLSPCRNVRLSDHRLT